MLAIRAALFPHGSLPHDTFVVLSVIAALGVILTSAYLLRMIRISLQGENRWSSREASAASEGVETTDLHPLEWLAWSPLLVLTVVLGVAPGLLLTPVAEAMTGVLR